MPDYRIGIFCTQAGAKWTIPFYSPGNSAVQVASDVEFRLIDPLANMLDQLTTIRSVTVANVNGARDSVKFVENVSGRQQSTTTSFADVYKVGARFLCRSEEGSQRGLVIRGLTDSAVERTSTGRSNPSPSFTQQYRNFVAAIQQMNLAIRVKQPISVAGYQWFPIRKIEPEADTDKQITKITTSGNHGLGDGDQVTLSFPRDNVLYLPYRGIFTVLPGSTATTFTVAAQYVSDAASITPKKSRSRKIDYVYHEITSVVFDKFTARDTADIEGSRGHERAISYR